jgi:hypothetical protein
MVFVTKVQFSEYLRALDLEKAFSYAVWIAPSGLIQDKILEGIRDNLVGKNITFSDLLLREEEEEVEGFGEDVGEEEGGREEGVNESFEGREVEEVRQNGFGDFYFFQGFLFLGVLGLVAWRLKRSQWVSRDHRA